TLIGGALAVGAALLTIRYLHRQIMSAERATRASVAGDNQSITEHLLGLQRRALELKAYLQFGTFEDWLDLRANKRSDQDLFGFDVLGRARSIQIVQAGSHLLWISLISLQ